MKKILLSVATISAFSAQVAYNFLPYGGKLNFTGSTNKKNGYFYGVYLSKLKKTWKTEIDIEHSIIFHKDHSNPLRQNDISILLNKYIGYNEIYKYGIHLINSSDSLTNNGKIFTFSYLYYKYLNYNYGYNIHYSYYSNQLTSPSLLQFSISSGYNFGNYYSPIGSFYSKIKLDYITVISHKDENSLNNAYLSTEFDLINYNGIFTNSLSIWIGERAFHVDENGFIVNNSINKQTGGFQISEIYKLNKYDTLKLGFSNINFQSNGESQEKILLLSYEHKY